MVDTSEEGKYQQDKPKVCEIIKNNPKAYGKLRTDRARNDKDILNAFLKGLIAKKDKFLFLQTPKLKVPEWFYCSDDFLIAEAAISGLGYMHMKQLGKTYLIDDELIYTTISNLKEEKNKTGSASIFPMYMLSGIPEETLTENICFEILMLSPQSVIRLPEQFFKDSLFERLLDNGNARWLDMGDVTYKNGFYNTIVADMFEKLSERTVSRAVFMQRDFFHPDKIAVLSEKELDYISTKLPLKYKHITFEDPEQLNLFDISDLNVSDSF